MDLTPVSVLNLGRSYLATHPEYQTADAVLNDIEQALFQQDAEAAQQMDSHRVTKAIKERVPANITTAMWNQWPAG